MRLFICVLGVVFIAGCANPNQKDKEECGIAEILQGISCITPNLGAISKHPLGSRENPVKADGPAGQRAYLSRLICTNGEPVSDFHRAGSVGIGPYGFMLDLYIVLCDTHQGVVEHNVFMDLYHSNYREGRVAEGFGAVSDR